MSRKMIIERGTYHDSVTLMLASRDAEDVPGVRFAAAVAATPVNLELLMRQGFELADPAGPDDLVIAVEADDDVSIRSALAAIETRLKARPRSEGSHARAPRSLRGARRRDPGIDLAFVAVPGRFAAYEVASAIEAGMNVFCFSDGVSIEAEAALKRRAADNGLLLMGPDCGTAIVGGAALGFANALSGAAPGTKSVGIVGASGTGTQEVCCLLDGAGIGVSHAIGVGGRDLSDEVGGIMTLAALRLLDEDPATDVIVVISKPPGPAATAKVFEMAATLGKPVVMGLLGDVDLASTGGVEVVDSLEEAARRAAALAGAELAIGDVPVATATPGTIVGLFCGGTLCTETERVVAAATTDRRFVDFGADRWTQGRAHPMIDPTLRNEELARAVADPSTGVIVADVVLGFGAHPDPAHELVELLRGARAADAPTTIVTICGTRRDPQNLIEQATVLEDAGVLVTRSAGQAGRLALRVAGLS